ncbi:MAG: hypothetical protein ACTSPE_03185 [Candidatus Thorarchaeota archaeon]
MGGEDLARRVIAAFVLFVVLLLLSFAVGAFILLAGAMSEIPLLSVLAFAGEESLVSAVTKALLINLFMIALIMLANHCRVRDLNFGYLVIYANTVLMGLFAGTDSFAGGVSTFTLDGWLLFARIGLVEFSAYILICAATVPLTVYYADAWRGEDFRRTRNFRNVSLNRSEAALIVLSFLLLLVAAVNEWLFLVNV